MMRMKRALALVIVAAYLAACNSGPDDQKSATQDPLDATTAEVSVASTGVADVTTAASAEASVPLAAADRRDEWGDPIDSAPLLPADKQELVDALDPLADCATDDFDALGALPNEQSVLQIVRAVGDCVIIENVVVPTAELEQRTADAVSEPDVIAAGQATMAFTDSTRVGFAPDPSAGQQHWWLDDLRIGGLDALTVDPATPKVRVAVIDSGIDDTSPDLAGLVVGRAPWAPAPTSKAGNHGTHVAGIIAAAANNGTAGRGIAQHVEFLDVNNSTGVSVSEMIDWATDHGADVINMSFCEIGTDGKPPCRDTPSGATIGAIAWAAHRGVLMFASAGNCGPLVDFGTNQKARAQCASVHNRVTYPGAYQRVISVGAYTRDGTIAGFSTQNDFVDVSAPGEDITSTVVGGAMEVMSGTSQASPMVAGSAAAILAHRPDINPSRVLSGLFATVRDAGQPGWDREFGNGKIDPVTVAGQIDANIPAPVVTAPSVFPLVVGSANDRVLELQAALTTAGYDLGEPDGQYGRQTAAAVASFQADQGLNPSGQTDEKLLELASIEAGKAPPCSAELLMAAQRLPAYWVWSEQPTCAAGWAIMSSYLPDTMAGGHYLFRVRSDHWEVVSSRNGRVVTNTLAEGTAISAKRFAVLFGAPGWPGRVLSADDVSRFIWEGSLANVGTLPEAWEYVNMWLDVDGFSVWNSWLYDLGGSSGGGVVEQCFVEPAGYFGGADWVCPWSSADGGIRLSLIVDEQLTRATILAN